MLHASVIDISFIHYHQIKMVFGDIIGLHGIEHFSLDLVNPAGEMLFFSSTPQHAFEICSQGLAEYDGIICPEYYKNFEFYWWNEAILNKVHSEKIRKIREERLGLRYGFMLVRKWNDFYLIYSFATKKFDQNFQSHVINRINLFLQIGDYAYSNMRETYQLYCGNYESPVIEKFYTFQGGKPPDRYTENHSFTNELKNKIEPCSNERPDNIIIVDFNRKSHILS